MNKPLLELDDPRLVWLPFDEATRPRSGTFLIIMDSWWVSHPDKGLAFYSPTGRVKCYTYPAYNKNEQTVRSLLKPLYPWATVIHMPTVYIPQQRQ